MSSPAGGGVSGPGSSNSFASPIVPYNRRGGDLGSSRHLAGGGNGGGGGGGAYTPSSMAAAGPVAHLSIRKQAPSHVFYNEVFEVEFGVDAARGSNKSPPSNVAIVASLVPALETQQAPIVEGAVAAIAVPPPPPPPPEGAASLVLLEEPRISPSRRTGKLKCKIVPSPQHQQQLMRGGNSNQLNGYYTYAIEIQTKQSPPPSSTPVMITPVTTRAIRCVQYKLTVTPVDWNNVWYKDEGGRDKCMEVSVALSDENHVLVPPPSNRTIRLDFTLCYQSKNPGIDEPISVVSSQDILRTLGASAKANQLDDQGKARVRFRVEDVSKNHQGQDFVLKISANENIGNGHDIAPVFTPPVSVRSKRNKRLRTGSSLSASAAGAAMTGGRTSATSSTGDQTGGQQSTSLYGGGGSSGDPSTLPPPLNFDGPEHESTLRDAIQGVSQWADEVVNGLYPLQWHVLGYAQHPDGTPDYSRPYHSMPNPNPLINRVLSTYSESTRGQLRLIESAINRSHARRPSAASGGLSPGAPGAADSPYAAGMSSHQQPHHSEPYGMMMPPGGPLMPPPPHARIPGAGGGSQPPPHMQMHPSPFNSYQQAGSMRPGGASGDMTGMPPPHHPHPPPPNMMDPYRGSDHYPQNPYHHPNYFPRPPRGAPGGAPGAGPQLAGGPPPPRYDETADPYSMGPVHGMAPGAPPSTVAATASPATTRPMQRQTSPSSAAAAGVARRSPRQAVDEVEEEEEENREVEVEYILAKQYKSLRTGERLGFPAYSARREILGFYRESASAKGHGGHLFVPLTRRVADYEEIQRMATSALQEAIDAKNGAVHVLRDWGSIGNMIDHALVYDWSKDINSGPSDGPSGSSASRNRSSSSDL